MNRQKDKNQHSLHLAVAAATLGMSMGISSGVVLAGPTAAEQLPNEDTGNSQESLQLAAGNVGYDNIDAQARPPMGARPGTAFPKVEQPGTAFPKVEQPGTAYPKVERPGTAFPKVERPGTAYPKVERPGTAFPKVERPGTAYPKVEQPGVQYPKVEQPRIQRQIIGK